MKTLKVFLILLVASNSISAQDSLRLKQKRHEVGVDLTAFIKNYFNFNQNAASGVNNAPYYLQYRFHLRSNNNIRSGAGGSYSETETASPYADDQTNYKNKQQSFNFRVGFEHFENISSKFQVFYGVDLLSGNSYEKNDAPFWNGGYANGIENKTISYGAAPMLGIRYKLNKRLSLFTESSFQLNLNQSWQKKYYIPVSKAYQPLPDTPKQSSKSISTNFNFPLFIVVAFDI